MLLKKKYIKHLETELTKATSLRDYYYGRVIELEKENAYLKRRSIVRLFTTERTGSGQERSAEK
ncbi:MAG: hypothetical protein IKN72_03835 [Clostridia bacterium]|nr:hypothetical protein [Clostridia bacterium]